jgi:hypothetical protein
LIGTGVAAIKVNRWIMGISKNHLFVRFMRLIHEAYPFGLALKLVPDKFFGVG